MQDHCVSVILNILGIFGVIWYDSRLMVCVAKLAKALAWLSCVRSREWPEFKAYLRRALADSANYMSICALNE